VAILCLGEIVVDWLSFEPGESFHTATRWYRALGGNSANVAIGLGRLGLPVRLLGKIGNDQPGEFLRYTLENEHVDCSYLIVDPEAPTAQCYMVTTADGEHQYYNWPQPHAADLLRSDEIPVEELFEDTRIVHTTSISLLSEPRRSAVIHVLRTAADAGAIISFDGGFSKKEPVRKCTEEIIRLSHLVKMNEPELLAWAHVLGLRSGPGSPQSDDGITEVLARKMFDEIQPKALLVTMSSRGSLVVTKNHTTKCSPHKVVAQSEVGAGDAYVAGAIYMLTDRLSVQDASHLDRLSEEDWSLVGTGGNIAGALAATHLSAYGGMPTIAEFSQYLGKTRI
jgi:fructokinase